MSITITDTAATLTIVDDGTLIKTLDKDGLLIEMKGTRLNFSYGRQIAYFNYYDNIASPASADIDALMIILAGYISAHVESVQIKDSSGNSIDAVPNADGNYHLRVSTIQSIITSSNNSTSTNLAAGATFTGTSEETFGVNAIQTYLYTDQNCTLCIDQSLDSTNWDITDEITILAGVGNSRIVSSVAPYFRIRITNNGLSATTVMRAAAGMTPIISPLPRALSDDQRLKGETTITGRHNSERHAWINPTNEQAVSPVYRMVGTNFDGETKDPNFWTDGSLNDGTVTQVGGEIDLHTNTTTPIASAKYTSVRKARFVAGSAQLFDGGFNFKTAATANNIRRVGAYTTEATANTPVDGFYFELNNAAFSVNSIADGTKSSVASGSFNGELGVTWLPTADTYYQLTIEWTPMAAFFYVNGQLLHKKAGAHQSYYMTLPITIENINTAGSVDVSFETVGMYISRQGELVTNPTFKYLLANTTTVCKYGAGVLHGIVVTDNTGSVYIYDGITTGGVLIADLDTAQGSEPMGSVIFMVPFNDGLTIECDGSVPITVIYE